MELNKSVIKEIPIEKLKFGFPKYNIDPERYMKLHRKGEFYKEILESIKKEGMINPLLVIDLDNGYYQVSIGNNRLLVAIDLNYKELLCIIIPNNSKEAISKYKNKYYKLIDRG